MDVFLWNNINIFFHFVLAGTYVLLWRRGSNVITAANLMIIRDSRFRLVDGFNLEISNVMPQDAGDYVCQLSDEHNRDITHTVEILGKLLIFLLFVFIIFHFHFYFNSGNKENNRTVTLLQWWHGQIISRYILEWILYFEKMMLANWTPTLLVITSRF